MARKIRVQYPGALYHVIHRGNYQSDVFGSVGATKAFENALAQACERHGWRIHAYVLIDELRNSSLSFVPPLQ